MLFASWGAHGLALMIRGKGPSGFPVGVDDPSPIRPAPYSLIKWARLRSLIPTIIFDSERHFLERVHSSLESLGHKLMEMHNPKVFWNIIYNGAQITNRIPKHEQDLHTFVTAVLSDQMMISSIDVIPEMTARSGRLDFLFSGAVKNHGIAHCMVEFKNAHSPCLIHGIDRQLSYYMRSRGVDHGAYCVLDFRGEWFDLPKSSSADLQMELIMALKRADLTTKHSIKSYLYQLGKSSAPSKRAL